MRSTNQTLTAIEGIKVGHATNTTDRTGCTVILCPAGATAGVDVRGAAPRYTRNRSTPLRTLSPKSTRSATYRG